MKPVSHLSALANTSSRATQQVEPTSTTVDSASLTKRRRPMTASVHAQRLKPSPPSSTNNVAFMRNWPPRPNPAHARPGSARVVVARSGTDGAQPSPEGADAQVRLRYRDPLLLSKLSQSDVEVLLAHEAQMMRERERRDRCLAALKTHLHAQQGNRDSLRARSRASRESVQHVLQRARSRLAAILRELRLASASVALTTHAWRAEIVEIGGRSSWLSEELTAILGRLDEDVWHPLVRKLLTQLDFAPLPSGTDPFLMRWFGPGVPSWWREAFAAIALPSANDPFLEASIIAGALPFELPPATRAVAEEGLQATPQAHAVGRATTMPTDVYGSDPNVPRVLVPAGACVPRVLSPQDAAAVCSAGVAEARRFAEAAVATAPISTSEDVSAPQAGAVASVRSAGERTDDIEPGGLALNLRKRRVASNLASNLAAAEGADPLSCTRELFDASRCHSAHELAVLRRAEAVLAVASAARAATALVESRRVPIGGRERLQLTMRAPSVGDDSGSDRECSAAEDGSVDDSSSGDEGSDWETGDESADGSEEGGVSSRANAQDARATLSRAPVGTSVAVGTLSLSLDPQARSRARVAVDSLAQASDGMPEGACDPIWGWKANLAGMEMARLLYSPKGSADGGTEYAAILSRYRAVLRHHKETRCAITIQRRTRKLLTLWARERAKRESLRKYAAMRALVRLQGRIRGKRLRKEEAAMQEQLNEKAARRRGTLAIQRAWRDEGTRRQLYAVEVQGILSSSRAFLDAWRAVVPGAIEGEGGAERAQARWKNVRTLNMTVALSVCSMLRQRVRAAATIQDANKRMLSARHRAYFFAVASLQRMLRRAIKAYIARRDEREAARAYSWIEQTESVLLIQRTYRAYAAALHAALRLHSAAHRRLGGVRAVVQARELLETPHALAWLQIVGIGPLETQRAELLGQLDGLIRAREIRGKAEKQRDAARRRLHGIEGQRAIYERLVCRPDERLSLDAEDLAAEGRKQTAKMGRVQQAIDDIAGGSPRLRGGSRSLCDRCEGALLVVAQLVHQGTSWRGSAEPGEQLDGGLAMTMQLLRTRHERLLEIAQEEEARLSAREKLTNQHASLHGGMRALEALLFEARKGTFAAQDGETSPAQARPATDPVALASERLAALEEETTVVQGMLERLDGEAAELEQADHDFELICGGIALIESAVDTLSSSQQSLLEALRLQGSARRLYLLPSRKVVLAQRRWLRELGAFELAFEELCARKHGADLIEEELHLLMSIDAKNELEASNMKLTMSEESTLKRLLTDVAVWGGVFNHDEELQIELSSKANSTVKVAETDAGDANREGAIGGVTFGPRRARFTFTITINVGWATRGLMQRLQEPAAAASLSRALHRFAEHIGQPAEVASVYLGTPNSVRAPNIALTLRKARGGVRMTIEQLDKRLGYDAACNELPAEARAKQRDVITTPWDWCRGAMHAMRLRQGSAFVPPSKLHEAFESSHAAPRPRYAPYHEVDPKAAVEAAYAAPSIPPHLALPPETPHAAVPAGEDAQDDNSRQYRSHRRRSSTKRSGNDRSTDVHGGTGVEGAHDEPKRTRKSRRRRKGERSKKDRSAADASAQSGATDTATQGEVVEPDTHREFWKTLRNVLRGKMSLARGSLVHETHAGTREHATELVDIASLQLEHRQRVDCAKEYRKRLKQSLALDAARQRLMIHMATLTEPSLKPSKAIEAVDRRRCACPRPQMPRALRSRACSSEPVYENVPVRLLLMLVTVHHRLQLAEGARVP